MSTPWRTEVLNAGADTKPHDAFVITLEISFLPNFKGANNAKYRQVVSTPGESICLS